MQQQKQQSQQYSYSHRGRAGHLLGGLMIILPPLLLATSFQEGGDKISINGLGDLSGTSGLIAVWGLSLCSLVAGIIILRSAIKQAKVTYQIGLTPTGFLVPGSAEEATEIPYKDITDATVSVKGKSQLLTVTHSGGVELISSKGMESEQAFDTLTTLLKEKIGRS
jgi:hypothetical protein